MENVRDLIVQKLLTLSEGITPTDKAEAEAELPISKPTLDKYLNGEVVKIETAMKLITFFSQKVKERRKLIQTA